MSVVSKSPKLLLLLAMLTGAASGSLAAQTQDPPAAGGPVQVDGARPSEGPEIKGIISARSGDKMQVTAADGTNTVIAINDGTRISGSKGLFGLNRNKLAATSLLNGLPVTVKTVQSGDGLVASQITLQSKDLRTASMIRHGTDQRFAEQTEATKALRGRMGDIDQYNIKSLSLIHI